MADKFDLSRQALMDAALHNAQKVAHALLLRQAASTQGFTAEHVCVNMRDVAKACADDGTLAHLDLYRQHFITDNCAIDADGGPNPSEHFDTVIASMLLVGAQLVGSQCVLR